MPDVIPTRSTRLEVRKWEPRKPEDKTPLPIVATLRVELPTVHDHARAAVRTKALAAVKGATRARSVSALTDGSWCVIVQVGE